MSTPQAKAGPVFGAPHQALRRPTLAEASVRPAQEGGQPPPDPSHPWALTKAAQDSGLNTLKALRRWITTHRRILMKIALQRYVDMRCQLPIR